MPRTAEILLVISVLALVTAVACDSPRTSQSSTEARAAMADLCDDSEPEEVVGTLMAIQLEEPNSLPLPRACLIQHFVDLAPRLERYCKYAGSGTQLEDTTMSSLRLGVNMISTRCELEAFKRINTIAPSDPIEESGVNWVPIVAPEGA